MSNAVTLLKSIDQGNANSAKLYRARVREVIKTESNAMVQLVNENGEPVYAEISLYELSVLNIKALDEVYVSAATQTVFVEDFMI